MAKNPLSTEIYVKNMLDQFALRPLSLQGLCLTDFAADYIYVKNPNRQARQATEVDNDDNIEEQSGQAEMHEKFIPLIPGQGGTSNGYVEKRGHSIIIRWRNFSKVADEHNYYRELFMLFKPWRNEEEELLEPDLKALYLDDFSTRDTIANNYKKYNALSISTKYTMT